MSPCKRCGQAVEASVVPDYCLFCLQVIVNEWERWQEEPIDARPDGDHPASKGVKGEFYPMKEGE